MPGDFRGYAFLPLFGEPQATESLEVLSSRLMAVPAKPASCVKPPIGGLAFITTGGEVSAMLDAWWGRAVPQDYLPVLLLQHEPGLEEWVGQMDAEAVIGVTNEDDLALYSGIGNARAVVTQSARAVTELVITAYRGCFNQIDSADRPVRLEDATGTPYRPRVQPQQALRGALSATGTSMPGRAVPPELPADAVHLEVGAGRPSGLRGLVSRAAGMLRLGGRGQWVPEELTRLALTHQLGAIVGVTSRAGGVGKTAIAAALGIIYGEAVQGSGWCAAVVDQNIGNPDQWGRLSLDSESATVFEIMADIEAGREWTVPAWNRTPALAVYPERRDVGEGYAPGQIERFASELRALHMLSVVDLPNRLPAFTSAEASVSAGWVGVCDLLLLPTTDDPTRLLGVLDFLDAPILRGDGTAGRRPVRVVVPYVRSPLRAVRNDPGVVAMLDQIRRRVVAVVEIPKNERATLAIVKGQPITEIDAGLREAYVDLALTVARALAVG